MLTVGIDLGTTNSVVATVRGGAAEVLADEYGDRLTPSVVNFHPSGKIIVGAGARARKRVDPQHTIFSTKRLLGYPFQSAWVQDMVPRLPYRLIEGENSTTLIAARGNTYTLPEVSALILRRLREVAIMQTGAPIERAVITVPAHFNELQRAATKVAGRIAGLDVMRVINEPTAAALAYFRDGTSRKRVVVYDFGGGTFDCTVLDLSEKVYEVLATCGDSFLGGDDVDTAIALRMRENLLRTARLDAASDPALFDRMRSAAEELKILLSSQQSAQIQLQEVGFGTLGRAIHLDFGMSVQEYNQILTPFLDRTLQKTQEALSLAGVSASAIDHVILVGGSTRSPLVQARLRDFFGQSPLQHVNVEHAVAIGAAYQAAALSDVAKRRTIPEPPPVFDPARQGSLPSHPSHDPRHTLPLETKIPTLQPGRTSSMPPMPSRTSSMPPLPGRISSVPPERTAPILVDVTPRALVVETAGGFCDTLIPRNARIPCGRARQFSMGKDFQTFVRIRVAQGESARFNENTYLGEVVLSGLRSAPRGEVVLSVSFDLDEGGLLRVSAKDLTTTKEAHAVLQLVGFAGSVEGMQLRLAQSTVSARGSVVPPQR